MNVKKLIFRVHALKRMFERNISVNDVRHVVENGEVIEEYPEDEPYPSYLLLGWIEGEPLHVVIAEDEINNTGIIVTVYRPAPDLWTEDFRRRKL